MPYLKQPKAEDPNGESRLQPGQVAPPSVPLPVTPNPQGGAPKLNSTPPVFQGKPFWRLTPPQAPTSLTHVPPAPWDRETIQQSYGGLIKTLGDSLWERYQALPVADQQTDAFWSKVGQNAQEVAHRIVARGMTRLAQVPNPKIEPAVAEALAGNDEWRWLKEVTRRG